jgi:hypothetical protein
MGHKPSNIFQMDRPESGGADHNEEREASGLLDRAKQEFAESESRKKPGNQVRSNAAAPKKATATKSTSRGTRNGRGKRAT